MRVLQLHIADGRVETDGPVTMSGHCSRSVGISQQTLQSCFRQMWSRAFSIQFLSSNYTFSKSGWFIHRVIIILTKHATVIRYSNSDPWPLFPIFDWSKTIGRGSQIFLTKIQNRKSCWPCNPNCARICSDPQTVSAVKLAWWWELNDTCFATLDFVIPTPGVWRLVAALYTIHHLYVGALVTVVARLQAGWLRMHGLIPARGKSFLSVPESCEKLWDRLWSPVVTGGFVPEVKAARTWSWHLRLPRIK